MSPAPFVARVSKWRTGLLMALALFVAGVGVSVLFIRQPDPHDALVVRIIGGFILALGLAALVFLARRIGDQEPQIEIGPAGIRWRQWSDDTISWGAIERARVSRMRNQRFVSLWLRNPDAYRSTRLLGRLARANKLLGFGDIALNPQGLDRNLGQLVAAIEDFAPGLIER